MICVNQYEEVEKYTATVAIMLQESSLLKISSMEPYVEPNDILDLERISPKQSSWQVSSPWEEKEKSIYLALPERLTNPQYGTAKLEESLRELAKNAPDIREIWQITEKLPSLTQLILEERENE